MNSREPEEQPASNLIYQGRLINLRAEALRIGGRLLSREVVEHPGAVAVVPLLDDGRVVLVEQFRLPAGRSLLEIPAGTIHGEENPEECAARELAEETGYRPGKLEHLFSAYSAPGYSSEIIHAFLATDLQPDSAQPDEDEEIATVVQPLLEAVRMCLCGELHDLKTIAALLCTAERLAGEKR